jgi:hypothetical protein
VAALLLAALVGLLAVGGAAVWQERLRGEERTRQAVLDRQVSDALDEAEEHFQQRRLAAALTALARVEGLQASGHEGLPEGRPAEARPGPAGSPGEHQPGGGADRHRGKPVRRAPLRAAVPRRAARVRPAA